MAYRKSGDVAFKTVFFMIISLAAFMLAAVFGILSFAEDEPESGQAGSYTVSWYVNGVLSKTTEVQEGQKPVYGDIPDRGVSGAEFAGWSSEPDSVEYKAESELPPVSSCVSYYAAFTEKTFFYMVLEGKQNTSSSIYDYMYSGTGLMLVPDGYAGERWYTGGNYVSSETFDIAKYIITPPDDSDLRRGLAAAYGSYSDSWQYIIKWTTLSHSSSAAGYDYSTISSEPGFHCDGAICIDRGDTAGVMYEIRMADESILLQSSIHDKNSSFPLNSTVSQTEDFQTDGYTYKGLTAYGGAAVHFDGWYTDPQYMHKASDTWTVTGASVLYGRYIDTYTVSFLDYDGTLIKSDGTYRYGDTLRVPADPKRGQDASYSYSFLKWDPNLSDKVTKDAVYQAVYSAVKLPAKQEDTGNSGKTGESSTADAGTAGTDAAGSTSETASAEKTPEETVDEILPESETKPAVVINMIALANKTGSAGGSAASGLSGAGSDEAGTDGALTGAAVRHRVCILHILILLASLVLFVLFMIRDRKECRKIRDLKTHLARSPEGSGDH